MHILKGLSIERAFICLNGHARHPYTAAVCVCFADYLYYAIGCAHEQLVVVMTCSDD